jgi:hypothetical protein
MKAMTWGPRALVVLLAIVTAGLVASPASAGTKNAGLADAGIRNGDAAGSATVAPQRAAEGPSTRRTSGQSAPALVATPEVWYTHWYSGPTCNGNICSSTYVDSIPRFYVSGQNFTLGGTVDVAVFHMDGTAKEWTRPTARSYAGFAGGSWGWKASQFDCWAIGSTAPADSFIQAYDRSSGRWSNRIYVYTGCRVL